MLKNVKVTRILIVYFTILVVIVCLVGAVGLINMSSMKKQSAILYSDNLIPVSNIGKMEAIFLKNLKHVVALVYQQDVGKTEEVKQQIADNAKQFDGYMTQMNQIDLSQDKKAMLVDLQNSVVPYREVRQKILDSVKAGNFDAARSVMADFEQKTQDLNDRLAALDQSIQEDAKNSISAIDVHFRKLTYISLGILVALLLFSAFANFKIVGSIRRPMGEMVNAIGMIAKGNLSESVSFQSKNEFGILAAGFRTVTETLRKLVTEAKTLTGASAGGDFTVRASTDGIEGGYKDILDGVNKTLDTVSDKAFWYEGLLDSMSYPVRAMDTELNMTFANKSAAMMMGQTRAEIIGQHCSADTEAAIDKMRNQNDPVSMLVGRGIQVQLVTSQLNDRHGENIGFVQAGSDVTKERRKAAYQAREVERLAQNLGKLAQGMLDFDLMIADADQYTQEDRDNFLRIADTLKTAQENLSAYIGETAAVLSEMAKGKLDVAATGDFKGEFAQIKESINYIVDSLNNMMTQINQSSSQVLSGAGQVASAAQTLSQGATEQASSIEELSATIEDISNQIKKNAENAQNAKKISVDSANTIEELNAQMVKMIQSMDRINESSQKISKIIKAIDEIAFQTNILALNAAVEAARAGEAGKGFAVVADEVRNLASKSAEAAKDTAALIEGSIAAVSEGTVIANETAKTLSVIVDETEQSGRLIGDISEASRLQANAIAQTTQGVNQISSVVQMNSATAEESAAASEELSGQASMLNELVGRFHLREQQIDTTKGGTAPLRFETKQTLSFSKY